MHTAAQLHVQRCGKRQFVSELCVYDHKGWGRDGNGSLHARSCVVANEHAASVVACKRQRETLQWVQRGSEIAVGVRAAHHFSVFLFRHFLVPYYSLVVSAALQRKACLQLEPFCEGSLSLYVQSEHLGTIGIVSFLHNVALVILVVEVANGEHVVEYGVESFHQEVCLHVAKAAVEVCREAEAVRPFLLQVVGKHSHKSFASHHSHVKVLVKRLWCAEASRISGAEVDVFGGIVSKVGTRAEDDVADEVVLVKSSAKEEAPALVLPLVLQVSAADLGLLVEVAVVAENHVFKSVVVILCSQSEVGGHEEQSVELTHILCTHYIGKVFGGAIGFLCHLALLFRSRSHSAVVAFALGCLEREVGGQAVVLVGAEEVVVERTSVDVVLRLLTHVCRVGSLVEKVAAASVFVNAMVLQRDFRIRIKAQERAQSNGLVAHQWQFGVSVAVVVVGLAIAFLSIDKQASLVVVGHHRGVCRGGVVERRAARDVHQRVAYLGRVSQRFACDDVYRSANGRRAVESRSTSAHHLHAFNHVRRYLFKSINSVQGGENRSGVYENLGVMSVKTIDTHLGETAVLAVVLSPHSRLEVQSFGKASRLCEFESFRPYHADEVWRKAAFRLASVG